MNRVPSVEGKIKLDLYHSGLKEDKIYKVNIGVKSNGFSCEDGESPWLDYNERMTFVDTKYLTYKETEYLKDEIRSYSGITYTYANNYSILEKSIISKIMPSILDDGIFSEYYGVYWKCVNEANNDLVRDEIERLIYNINNKYKTDYYAEFDEVIVKAPSVVQFATPPKDKLGNDIEMGDTVAVSPLDTTGVTIRQIVGLGKKQAHLDNGGRPFYENILVIKKYNGKPVSFGY